ncbi:MAG: hypothetical protein KIG36_03930 [Eubacteriales bacterium]|nr:hypothetical protein [Eubacteriales bacterium]
MELIDALKKADKAAVKSLMTRYGLLRAVSVLSPMGRRALGEATGLTERETRDILEELRAGRLISSCRAGVSLTAEGREAMERLFGLFSPDGGPVLCGTKTALMERAALAADAVSRDLTEDDLLLVDNSAAVRYAVGALRRERCRFRVIGTAGNYANANYLSLAEKLLLPKEPPPVLPKGTREMAAFVGTREAAEYTERLAGVTAILLSVRTVAEAMKATDMSPRLVNLLIDQGATAELAGYYLRNDGRIVYTSLPLAPTPEFLATRPVYVIASEKSGPRELEAVRSRCARAVIFS